MQAQVQAPMMLAGNDFSGDPLSSEDKHKLARASRWVKVTLIVSLVALLACLLITILNVSLATGTGSATGAWVVWPICLCMALFLLMPLFAYRSARKMIQGNASWTTLRHVNGLLIAFLTLQTIFAVGFVVMIALLPILSSYGYGSSYVYVRGYYVDTSYCTSRQPYPYCYVYGYDNYYGNCIPDVLKEACDKAEAGRQFMIVDELFTCIALLATILTLIACGRMQAVLRPYADNAPKVVIMMQPPVPQNPNIVYVQQPQPMMYPAYPGTMQMMQPAAGMQIPPGMVLVPASQVQQMTNNNVSPMYPGMYPLPTGGEQATPPAYKAV